MKAKKTIVRQLMKSLVGLEVTKETLADYIRFVADEDDGFEDKVFEIGVKALVKEFRKLRHKDIEGNEETWDPKAENDQPLHYHEIESDEELEVLTGLSLVSRMKEWFGDDGDGTDFTFKEISGVKKINLFVMDDGGMYLSDWY